MMKSNMPKVNGECWDNMHKTVSILFLSVFLWSGTVLADDQTKALIGNLLGGAMNEMLNNSPPPQQPPPQPMMYEPYPSQSYEHVGAQRHLTPEEMERMNWMRDIQTHLSRAGYYQGALDGIEGKGTRAAIELWEADFGEIQDGIISKSELISLSATTSDMKLEKDKVRAELPAQESEPQKPLCLDTICMGMTMNEVLAQDINIVDGRKLRIAEREDRENRVRQGLGMSYYPAMLMAKGELAARGIEIPDYATENSDASSLNQFRNLEEEEKGYLSTFIPENGTDAPLDRKALMIVSKATICTLKEFEMIFLSDKDFPTVLTFTPLGDDLSFIVTKIQRYYDYKGPEIERFKENIMQEYKGFRINEQENTDVEVATGEGDNSLTLISQKIYNHEPLTSRYGVRRIGYDKEALKQEMMKQEGCYDRDGSL